METALWPSHGCAGGGGELLKALSKRGKGGSRPYGRKFKKNSGGDPKKSGTNPNKSGRMLVWEGAESY